MEPPSVEPSSAAVDSSSVAALLAQAEQAWTSGVGEIAMALFERAARLAEQTEDLVGQTAAVLGLARGQRYNLTPGLLPVRLHTLYDLVEDPGLRIQLAAALARCWAYANEPRRAQPFAIEALHLAERTDDPVLLVDALDAALVSHWGPDDLALRRTWAIKLGDAAAHLTNHDARLQAELWTLTVAWEVLDLPRMHRAMRAIDLLADESPRAEFFAASRRLPLELLRRHLDVIPLLVERAAAATERAVIPDGSDILHSMRGYAAYFTGDPIGCANEAPAFEEHANMYGVATVRAEAAVVWLGAGRLDKVTEMIGVFTPEVLADLPRDSDWLLVMQCLLEGALAVRNVELAGNILALLTPYVGRSVVNAGAVMWHGVTDDTLARAYALVGDLDSATRHAQSALATYERIGATWWRDRLRRQLPTAGRRSATTDETIVHLHRQPGGLWLVGREGATFVLPQMRGLAHLHTLLSRPDTDHPAATMAGTVIDQSGLEVIDAESRRYLITRLADLEAEIELADRPELREERDAIASYLGTGSGLGRRSRTTGSSGERARVAVRKAIVAALARIAENDPWLGRHLHDRVRTGFECRYDSDPDHPIRWMLRDLSSP